MAGHHKDAAHKPVGSEGKSATVREGAAHPAQKGTLQIPPTLAGAENTAGHTGVPSTPSGLSMGTLPHSAPQACPHPRCLHTGSLSLRATEKRRATLLSTQRRPQGASVHETQPSSVAPTAQDRSSHSATRCAPEQAASAGAPHPPCNPPGQAMIASAGNKAALLPTPFLYFNV